MSGSATQRFADLRDAFAGALAFALPVSCAACGEPGHSLCARCRAALTPCVRAATLADGTRVWSGLDFAGEAAAVLRALKEEGRTALARNLAPALRAALQAAAEETTHPGDAPLVTVTVPTSRAALRRRGYRVPDLLSRRAGVVPLRALRPVRRTADQRALGREARRGNVAGSLQARGVAGVRVVVVDDVVTTGATLSEAARALREAGATVVGAATVAATPLRSTTAQSGA